MCTPKWRRLAALAALALGAAPTPPAHAAAGFITDDADTADKKGWEVSLVSTATQRSGQIGGVFASLEAHYGVTDRFEVHGYAPLAFDKTDGQGLQAGAGDVAIGAKYRLLDQADDAFVVSISIDPTLVLPSGSASHNLGTGRLNAFLPVWASRSSGKWSLFGGGGYAINPGPANIDWFLAGAGATYEVSERWVLGGELFYTSASVRGEKGGGAFNLGGTYMISKTSHIVFSVGRNLNNAAAVNQASGVLGIQFNF